MHTTTKKLLRLLVLGILFISVISLSCCFGEENNNDDKKNNENGNGNNGETPNNNTTNGNGEPPIENIKFIELRTEPQQVNIGAPVQFFVKLESINPIKKVELLICIDTVCLAPFTMQATSGDGKEYSYVWDVPADTNPDSDITYQVIVNDSLGNTEKSSKIILEII